MLSSEHHSSLGAFHSHFSVQHHVQIRGDLAVQTETWGQALTPAQSWLNAEVIIVKRNCLISMLEVEKNTLFTMQPEHLQAM